MPLNGLAPSGMALHAMPEGVERFPVIDRTSWLRMRGRDVTASVAGALLGVHEFVTPYQLYALKAGLVAEDPEETPPMRRGRLLEPIALQVLREDNPTWRVEKGAEYYRHADARIGATPDALAIDPERPGVGVIQVKSVEPSAFRTKWQREDGTVESPLWIACQAIAEATLTGASWAIVAALVVGHGVEVHPVEVPIHAGIMERLRAEVALFWQRVERNDPPDPDFGRDGATIAALYPTDNGREIDLTADNRLPEIAAERDRLKSEIKTATKRVYVIDAEIKHRLGPYEAALVAGGRRITWRTEARRQRFFPPSESRVLRISPAR